MRMIHISQLTGEEILARSIYDAEGRTLLRDGTRLMLYYVERLDSMGVEEVYIEDEISEGIEINPVISQHVRQEAKQLLWQGAAKFLKHRHIDVESIRGMVTKIIDDLTATRDYAINLTDMRIKGEHLLTHSIDVCILAVTLANRIGFSQDNLKSIALGCLLHDFGKILIPDEILAKGDLSAEEFAIFKQHTEYGYKVLGQDSTISAIAKTIVLMHHEREDGNGYMGIKGDKLHKAVKIGIICNGFDNVYKYRDDRLLNTGAAVRHLLNHAGTIYDSEFVKEFVKHIPIFTVGSIVLLTTGAVGIIVKNNRENLLRPVIRLLYNAKTRIKYSRNNEINLLNEPLLNIDKEILFDREEYKRM